MKERKTILLDLDGILAHLHKEMLHRYNTRFRKDLPHIEYSDHLFGDHEILSPDIHEPDFNKAFLDHDLFLKCPLIDGAKESVQELDKHFHIYFVSTPWISNPHSFTNKYDWVEKHWGNRLKHRLVLTGSKEAVYGDILVDDRMKNLDGWKKRWPHGRTASLKYPWTDPKVVDIIEPDWYSLCKRLLEHK